MMMRTILLTLIAVVATASAHAVTITGFGSGQFQTTLTDFITVQSGSTYSISGANDGGTFFVGKVQTAFVDTPVSILGNPDIKVTLTINSAITSSFSIELVDPSNNVVGYDGSFASFSIGIANTVSLSPNPSLDVGTFNGSVARVVFTANGLGLSAVDVTFDELFAVPEPSSLALLGGAGVLALRRVRRRM